MRIVSGICLLLLAAGCGQNASDQPPQQAAAEKGLRPVEEAPPMPAGHPPVGAMGGAAAAAPGDLGGLAGRAPAEWRAVKPSSSMRLAEYALPGYPAGATDAVLAVFHFGPNQGGGVDANIQRWISQFTQPDGSDTQAKARKSTRTVQGMAVTLVDIEGTYNGGMGAGGQAEPQADYRMLGAVVEAPGGVYFYKLTGPRSTVAHWSDGFAEFIGSLRP